MKKVGILNFHFSRWNYGAILQACALDYAINNAGYEAEHIDLVPMRTKPVSSFSSTVPDRNRFADNPEVFEDFRDRWLHRSKKRYGTLEELEYEVFEYSGVVVGSDGVWSYNCTGDFWPAYAIQFENDNIQKIAYAPSFGMPVYDRADDTVLVEKVAKELKRFDSISVREISGLEVLEKTFEYNISNVAHVLDPTLLVGTPYFQNIIDTEKPDVSTVSKIVYHKATRDNELGKTLRYIEEEYGVKPENILSQKYDIIDGEEHYKFSTVPEWLLKIKKSELVITDSFHCFCLALLFGRKVIHLPSPTSPNPYKDCRLMSLFGLLKQDFDKVSVTHDTIKDMDILGEYLEYPIIEKELEVQREISISYLTNALGKM